MSQDFWPEEEGEVGWEDSEIASLKIRGDIVPGKSVEEIQKENALPPFPPGPQVVAVKTFKVGKDGGMKPMEGWYQGKKISYLSRTIQAVFCRLEDHNKIISDFFQMPPDDDHEKIYYEESTKEKPDEKGKTKSKGGFHAKKTKTFLAALGFRCNDEGVLEPDAWEVINWLCYPETKLHRLIGMTVVPPAPVYKQKGDEYSRIQLFSYKLVPDWEDRYRKMGAEVTHPSAVRATAAYRQSTPPDDDGEDVEV